MKSFKFLFVLSLFLAADSSQAYIPPPGFILKKITTLRQDLKEVTLKIKLAGFDGDQAVTEELREVVKMSPTSGIVRSEIQNRSGDVLYVGNRPLTSDKSSIASLLFFGINPVRLTRALANQSPPASDETEMSDLGDMASSSEKLSLKRWENRYFWVLNEADNQLWVEKDTFYPFRLIIGVNSDKVELKVDRYQMTEGYPFPSGITLSRKDQKKMSIDIEEVQVSKKPNPLKEDRRKSIGFTAAGDALSDRTKSMIQDYYLYFR